MSSRTSTRRSKGAEPKFSSSSMSFLHLVVGASDGRERPGRTPPLTEPRGRGGFIRRLIRYLDNSLLGDALGAVALFALLFAALWLPEVLR
ncbi:hypothetical protein SAMN04488078_101573 [Antarctobacter heliothermus]|uniref:Uncharacterized protein n=2 Tax=Antarctobacter heliothermus TaxID=74033 RepID=A0A239EJZ8_9RHOB|nr:hypothetical protein SAMN04488078_101573 [Antarctobacter heliothermus]